MGKYKVTSAFQDKDTKAVHALGGFYESDDAKRVKFLQDAGYLEKDEAEFPKHTGGGHYELSNGDTIKGKDKATAAEEELQKSGE